MNDTEIAQMLKEIFARPAIPVTPTPAAWAPGIQRAMDLAGINSIPVIVIDETPRFAGGSLDFNTYDETVIRLTRNHALGEQITRRSDDELFRTLIHEIGHWTHWIKFGWHHENAGWKACEDFADDFRDIYFGFSLYNRTGDK